MISCEILTPESLGLRALNKDSESVLRVSLFPSRLRLRRYRFTSDDSLVDKPFGITNHSGSFCICTSAGAHLHSATESPEKHSYRIMPMVTVGDEDVMSKTPSS